MPVVKWRSNIGLCLADHLKPEEVSKGQYKEHLQQRFITNSLKAFICGPEEHTNHPCLHSFRADLSKLLLSRSSQRQLVHDTLMLFLDLDQASGESFLLHLSTQAREKAQKQTMLKCQPCQPLLPSGTVMAVQQFLKPTDPSRFQTSRLT